MGTLWLLVVDGLSGNSFGNSRFCHAMAGPNVREACGSVDGGEHQGEPSRASRSRRRPARRGSHWTADSPQRARQRAQQRATQRLTHDRWQGRYFAPLRMIVAETRPSERRPGQRRPGRTAGRSTAKTLTVRSGRPASRSGRRRPARRQPVPLACPGRRRTTGWPAPDRRPAGKTTKDTIRRRSQRKRVVVCGGRQRVDGRQDGASRPRWTAALGQHSRPDRRAIGGATRGRRDDRQGDDPLGNPPG